MAEDDNDLGANDAALHMIEMFKDNKTPATKEQVAYCIAALMKVEELFSKLILLMTEVQRKPANAREAADAFLEVMVEYRATIRKSVHAGYPQKDKPE